MTRSLIESLKSSMLNTFLSIIKMKFIVQYFLHLGECLCKIKCEILLKKIMRNIVYFKFQ